MKPHEPEWLDLADNGLLQKVYFLYLDWPSGPLYLHSYVGDITIDGNVWKGVGVFGTMSSNGAAQVSQKPVITMKLSDVPDRAAGFVTPDGARGREAELYVGAKDPSRDDLTLIGGLQVEFFGRIGGVVASFNEVADDGTRPFDYSVDIEVGRSPRMPLTFYHSDADQRRRTGGADTALRHLAATFAEPEVWTPT